MGETDVKASANSRVSCGCLGCMPLLVTILAIWAMCFGVTYKGKRYALSCSCDKGVELQQ